MHACMLRLLEVSCELLGGHVAHWGGSSGGLESCRRHTHRGHMAQKTLGTLVGEPAQLHANENTDIPMLLWNKCAPPHTTASVLAQQQCQHARRSDGGAQSTCLSDRCTQHTHNTHSPAASKPPAAYWLTEASAGCSVHDSTAPVGMGRAASAPNSSAPSAGFSDSSGSL